MNHTIHSFSMTIKSMCTRMNLGVELRESFTSIIKIMTHLKRLHSKWHVWETECPRVVSITKALCTRKSQILLVSINMFPNFLAIHTSKINQ